MIAGSLHVSRYSERHQTSEGRKDLECSARSYRGLSLCADHRDACLQSINLHCWRRQTTRVTDEETESVTQQWTQQATKIRLNNFLVGQIINILCTKLFAPMTEKNIKKNIEIIGSVVDLEELLLLEQLLFQTHPQTGSCRTCSQPPTSE